MALNGAMIMLGEHRKKWSGTTITKNICNVFMRTDLSGPQFLFWIFMRVSKHTCQRRMRTTPIPIPNIPMVLMTRGMKENPVFDPSGAIFTGISGMAEMFDSWD
jgi:hypothetical protein